MARRAKILLVDDDELSLEIMQARLAERYDVVATNAPENVLRLARETEPDLIVCKELRHTALMFLTALATTGDINRMQKQIAARRAISKDA